MSGKGLNELELKDEKLPEQTFDDLPDFGTFTPPPQPGAYRFMFPANLAKVWETFDAPNKGQRIRAIFDRENPLTIVQSPANKVNGDSFQTRISNAERKRGKDGPEASDMDYVLRALGEKKRPSGNKAMAETFSKVAAGKEIGADLTYSWVCSADRDIRAYDDQGKTQVVEGTKGCGKKYYMKDVQRNEQGEYPYELQCECGAVVRAFANLENFRA